MVASLMAAAVLTGLHTQPVRAAEGGDANASPKPATRTKSRGR